MHAKYGKSYFSQTDFWLQSKILNPDKLNNLQNFKSAPLDFVSKTFSYRPSLKDLAEVLGVSETTAGVYVHQYHLESEILYVFSQMEQDVYEFLSSITSTTIIRNTKKVITPYELDLYLPELNLAIECNPTSTHNSTINSWNSNQPPMLPSYHKSKTDMCSEKGIFLFHIFGYEWSYKKDIIKSMLRNLVKKNSQKIFARNTYIREVNSKEARKFLDENHRQGYANASVKLGLYFNDKLVSLMTFGKQRHTVGRIPKNGWELVRFCNSTNISVVGGASKLFKYFVKTYNPQSVISFSDRAHTRGNLYSTLRFTEDHISSPGYVWVNFNSDRAYHRMNAQKSNIQKFLHDDTIDLNKTEKQIMEEHGFVQVFDSGTVTWVWNK